MTASFTAYIDEAGDEGFKFLDDGRGSSRWFVISAVVFRTENKLAPVEALKRARAALNKPSKYALHFRDLKHEQRLAYVQEVCKERFRTVSVLVHKPNIQEPERYSNGKFLLYKYVCRLLIERISWLCRDHRKADDQGDGTVDLVFSDRANMSYESLRDYLNVLLQQSALGGQNTIHWDAVNPNNVRAVSHQKLAGLQVADCIASGMFYASNLSQYGLAEPRYFEMCKPQVYAKNRVRQGYGLKFWPAIGALEKEMPHLAAFRNW